MDLSYIKSHGRQIDYSKLDPVQIKILAQKRVNLNSKQDYFGESPNIFVGRYGYPDINVGILSAEFYENNDEPLLWSRAGYSIPQIIDLRTQLVNSSFKVNIKSFNDKFLELSQEISMAKKPVDVEINLNKKPQFRISFNQDAMPHGPNAILKNAKLTENPSIPTKIDKIVSDTDLKAGEAIIDLYNSGYDEHYLTKLISVGNLGLKPQRKLVPTRWSITAIDDTIGKKIISKIGDYNEINYLAYFGWYFGNYYLILFFPGAWSYELFETIIGETVNFATDYENFNGRKDYADSTAGGYYACRLGILEKFNELKRKGLVLSLRFINPKEYIAPLGVWVVREATRKTLSNKPLEFSSKELMLLYAKKLVKKRFNFDIDILFRQSKLLSEIKTQTKLSQFA